MLLLVFLVSLLLHYPDVAAAATRVDDDDHDNDNAEDDYTDYFDVDVGIKGGGDGRRCGSGTDDDGSDNIETYYVEVDTDYTCGCGGCIDGDYDATVLNNVGGGGDDDGNNDDDDDANDVDNGDNPRDVGAIGGGCYDDDYDDNEDYNRDSDDAGS